MIITVEATYVEFKFSDENVYRIPIKDFDKYKFNGNYIKWDGITITDHLDVSQVIDNVGSKTYERFQDLSEIDKAIRRSTGNTVVYYGNNTLRNSNFYSWENDNPTFWTVTGESGALRYVNRDGSNNACHIYTDGSGTITLHQANIIHTGRSYRLTLEITDVSEGSLKFSDAGSQTWNTTGKKTFDFVASGTFAVFGSDGSVLTDIKFTDVLIREVRSSSVFNNNGDFEDGTWSNEWYEHGGNSDDAVIEIDTGIVNNGTYSLKLSHTLPGGSSTNRVFINTNKESVGRYNWGSKYQVGFSIYLKDYLTNPTGGVSQATYWNMLCEAHAVGQYNDGDDGEGGWGITISGYSTLEIWSKIYQDPYTYIPAIPSNTLPRAYITDVVENQWLDFVVHFILSPDNDGFIKWYYNGVKVVDITGPTVCNLDTNGDPKEKYNYLQIGSYKHIDSTNERILHYDDVKISGEQSIYDDVAPQ